MDEDSLTAQEEMKALIDKMGALSKQVKEKSDEEKYLFKTEVKKLQELLSCSQNREDTMTVEQTERLKASMYRMQAEFEQRTRQEETLKKQVRQAEETLADLRRQLEEKMQQPGAQPRAK
ncbi:uncharacterized protein LOC101846710 [Aplysia californica]|nr:uncharacterized protein LOC101846710 [Aplysia californica]